MTETSSSQFSTPTTIASISATSEIANASKSNSSEWPSGITSRKRNHSEMTSPFVLTTTESSVQDNSNRTYTDLALRLKSNDSGNLASGLYLS